MRKMIAVFFAFTLTASLVACNTMEGLGKDIKKVGQGIQDAADK